MGQVLVLPPGALEDPDHLVQAGTLSGVLLQHPEDQVGKGLGDLGLELLGGVGIWKICWWITVSYPPVKGGWPVRAS